MIKGDLEGEESPYLDHSRDIDLDSSKAAADFEQVSRIQHRIDNKSVNLMASLPVQYKGKENPATDQKARENNSSTRLSISNNSSRLPSDIHKGFPSKRQIAINNLKDQSNISSNQSSKRQIQ